MREKKKMKNKQAIRKAQIQDFESIYRFVNKLEDEEFDRQKQFKIFSDNLLNEKNIYLVATENGVVIGYLSCHIQKLLHHGGEIGEIQEMFVIPEKRSIGIGKILIEKLKEIAVNRKILQLEVTSNQKRLKAHSFYEAQKFIATHKKFVLKCK